MPEWKVELDQWLEPYLALLGHRARAKMCPLYVKGLVGPGARKSMEPIAARVLPGKYDRLHHFISEGQWDTGLLEAELARQADRLVGSVDAALVIDDTALVKKGSHSVGVAPQYASALGKTANCQTLVSVTLARDEVPITVGLRLFLPESWSGDPARLESAGVPEDWRMARTKPEIALAEINRLMRAGVRFGTVLADSGYGRSARFRQSLSKQKLLWAVGIPYSQKVYPADVSLISPVTGPVAGRGRPRNPAPNVPPQSAQTMFDEASWTQISWRIGTKGPLKAFFAGLRVRVADGAKRRVHGNEGQRMPGQEVWLIGEKRTSGELKYYLSNLPADTDLKTLAATIKARWVCEQAHQQMKQELGLDHFEGRSWQGLHRHALMVMIAYAFLQHRRLAEAIKQGEKNIPARAPSANTPSRTASRHHSVRQPATNAMPILQNAASPAT